MLSRLHYLCTTVSGLPPLLLDRLQSVLNMAARLIYASRRYDHVTPLLRSLRSFFAWADLVLAYRCLHSSAPVYLASKLFVVPRAHRLRWSSTMHICHDTIGSCTFVASATLVSNKTSHSTRSLASLNVFRPHLKTDWADPAFILLTPPASMTTMYCITVLMLASSCGHGIGKF